MSLFRLPSETLAEIFEFVGTSFFHDDLNRLTVCRQWFVYALPTCLKCVTLSQETLRSLVISAEGGGHSPLMQYLETLDLELERFYHASISAYNRQESNVLTGHALDEDLRDGSVNDWVEAVDSDLVQLANIAQRCNKLRSLHLRAWDSSPFEVNNVPKNYLSIPTMRIFLSLKSLSVLDLDLSVSFQSPLEERGGEGHVCPAIGAQLGTLKALRLRLLKICPDALKPRDPKARLRLSEVVVKLSLYNVIPGTIVGTHSKRCKPSEGGLPSLKASLHGQAEALAAQMEAPKIVRIMTHSLPNFEKESLDVLTGKPAIVRTTVPWDEDCKFVEGSDSESELSDDEFLHYLDD